MSRALPVLLAVLACVALPQSAWADVPRIPVTQVCMPPPQASADTVPWAQQLLGAQRVWQLTRGAGVTVAVVDTGVDGGAVQLSGRVGAGRDVRRSDNRPANDDCFGHGTFVAGIIAAAPADGTMFAGMAPDASILPIRVAEDATDITAGMLAKGIRVAVDLGARVVNVSASSKEKDTDLEAAIAYAAERDVLVVASAGNSAEQGNPTPYPAVYDTVLAVGAVDLTGKPASFSDTGRYLDLMAPGVDVCSIGPGGPGQWEASGTSYAAPFVAGVAALVRSYYPNLTAVQVKHRLEATAVTPPANVPSPAHGWGTVNPIAAVTAMLPEESKGGAVQASAPPNAHTALVPPSDRVRVVLVTLSVLSLLLVAAVACFGVRLVPVGVRRRWRPARVVELRQTD